MVLMKLVQIGGGVWSFFFGFFDGGFFYFNQWVSLLVDIDGGFLYFDGDFLLRCISDSGFWCWVSLFKVFLLGLNWLDVLDFYKTLTF